MKEIHLTCLSCENHRMDRCVYDISGWPDGDSAECDEFIYLPGSDESEDQSEID